MQIQSRAWNLMSLDSDGPLLVWKCTAGTDIVLDIRYRLFTACLRCWCYKENVELLLWHPDVTFDRLTISWCKMLQ